MPTKEGNSTFTPKRLMQTESPRSQDGESPIESPILEALEASQQKVAVADYYITQIVDNKIESLDELEARFVENRVGSNNGYLGKIVVSDRNDPFFRRKNESVIQLDPKDRFTVEDPEEKVLFRTLLTERNNAREDLKKATDDTQRLKDYVSQIFQGRVESQEELEARFAGFRTGSDNRYLRKVVVTDRNDPYFRGRNDSVIQLDPKESQGLEDAEQRAILTELLDKQISIRDEKQRAELEKKVFDTYAKQIIEGKIETSEELEARLVGNKVGSNNRYLGKVVVTDRNDPYFRRANTSVVELQPNEAPGLQDPEQKKLFTDLFSILKDKTVPEDIRQNVQNYLNTRGKDDFERLVVLLSTKDKALEVQVLGTIKLYEKMVRVMEFKNKFYSTFSTPQPDFKEQIQILNTFQTEDAVELELLLDLRDKAQAIKRLGIVAEFTQSLENPNRDFNQVLTILAELNRPGSSKEDKACAITLAKALTRLEIATYRSMIAAQIKPDQDPQELYRFIENLPIRPTVGSIDYIDRYNEFKNNAAFCFMGFQKIDRVRKVNEIRKSFITAPVQTVLEQIANLQDETKEELAIKTELLKLYKEYVAAARPQDFDQTFKQELALAIEERLQMQFIKPELGQNRRAFEFVRRGFVSTIFPLAESYKEDPRTKEMMKKYLVGEGGKPSPRIQFIQRLKELEKVRPLTDAERAYIQSVELLTLFNPYLIGVATADFGVTNAFLKHHFESLSKETTEGIKDGDYFPTLMIGTGPDGLAALGEMVRNNPELAEQSLVIDVGSQPGGPFAVPEGAAWELNSANERGKLGYVPPEAPGEQELQTVRAYGSPLRRYPGERRKGDSVRQGSINTTVDYLPTPDAISNARYPTNEELQCVLALQAAALTRNLALNTELISVEPNPNINERGDKIATLRITQSSSDGSILTERIVRIKTDGIFNSTGLGEKSYGFNLEGSRAQNVIQQTSGTETKRFPQISTTLEAFNALANRSEERYPPGETIVIYGNGNSTDTLVEYIGNLFQGDNPTVRNVKKIYIVTTGELSARPRYAAINDIKAREGRNQGNLIEIVNARVSDLDFATQDGKPTERQLVVYDSNGKIITDNAGNPIKADSVIAATGFRPQLQKIFANYVGNRPLRGEGAALKPLTLPTNPDVAVAEYFGDDPTIVILGTASNPAFNLQKFAQLPKEAREALLRNGAENAVAIGFRAPDSQAAMNIFLNSFNINLQRREKKNKKRIPVDGTNKNGNSNRKIPTISFGEKGPRIPNNVEQEDLLLSPLLSYLLGNKFGLDRNFSGDLNFSLEYTDGEFQLSFDGGALESVSEEFIAELAVAVSDKTFQTYSASLLGKRRRNKKLNLCVGFLNGEIHPGKTFVEA
jgi:hypothetical protein